MTGAALKQIRTRWGLLQREMAERVGVTSNTIARYERGELPIPETLARLVTLLAQQNRSRRKG
jgi:transcriptional regulator with XRE-family HTH domain